MKKAVLIGYYAFIVIGVVFACMSFRWLGYKDAPELVKTTEHVYVPITRLKDNAKPGEKYFYSIDKTVLYETDNFPFVKETITEVKRTPADTNYYTILKE